MRKKISAVVAISMIATNTSSLLNVYADDLVKEKLKIIGEKALSNATVSNFKLRDYSNFEGYNQEYRINRNEILSISNNGGQYSSSSIDKAIDGNLSTHWETGRENSKDFKNEVVVEFENIETIDRIAYATRQDSAKGKGYPIEFEIYASATGKDEDFKLESIGSHQTTGNLMEFKFDPISAKKIKFVFKEANQGWASASEFWFYKKDELINKLGTIFTDDNLNEVSEEFNTIEKLNAFEEKVANHPFYEKFKEDIENAKLVLEGNTVEYKDAVIRKFKDFNDEVLVKYNELFKINASKISTNGGHYGSSNIEKAIDGNINTSWHSGKENNNNFTNEVTITLDKLETLDRVVYTSLNSRGFAKAFDIYTSKTSSGNSFEKVTSGSMDITKNSMEIKFNPTQARRVKFVFKEGYENWALASEFALYRNDAIKDKLDTIFTNVNMSEVSEEFNTIEKLQALENEAKNHIFYEDYIDDFEVAKDLVEAGDITESEFSASKFIPYYTGDIKEYDKVYRVAVSKITNNGGHYGSDKIENAIDDNINTHWETGRPNDGKFKNIVELTLEEAQVINRLSYKSRNGEKGFATDFDILVSPSAKGDNFVKVTNGKHNSTGDIIGISFNPTKAKRVKFVFNKAREDFASIADMRLYKEDAMFDKMEGLFVDKLMTQVANQYNTKEALDKLKKEVANHPLEKDFLSQIARAEKALDGELTETKTVVADQYGNMERHAQQKLQFGFGNNNQSTGVYALAGETIVVYVDADPNGPMPRLFCSQQEGSFANWGRGVTLTAGRNVIKVPEVPTDNWYKNDVTKGGALYITNPYTKEEQPKTPVIRFENAKTFPILDANTNDAQLVEEIKEHKKLVDADKKAHPNVKDRKVMDIFEFTSKHVMFTGTTSGAYDAYVNRNIKPSETIVSWNKYMGELMKYYGFDGSNEYDDIKNVRENVRLAQPFGYMYAAGGHVGVQGDVMTELLVPFEQTGSNWGITHEIGHKMDMGKRVYGETTNNMLPLYMDYLYGKSPGHTVNYDTIYKYIMSENSNDFMQSGVFDKLAPFWQLELAKPGYWGELNSIYRERDKEIKVNDELSKYKYIVEFSSEIMGADMSEYFARHGFKVSDEQRKDLANKYPKLDKKLWYANDNLVKYKGNGFVEGVKTTVKTSVVNGKTKLSFKTSVNGNKDLLGYEILKDGKVIGFTNKSSFVDENTNLDENSVYSVVTYDNKFNTLPEVEIDSRVPSMDIDRGITLKLNENFNPKEYVKAFNNKGVDITSNVIIKHNVDNSKRGNYEITYSITDNNKTITETVPVSVVSDYEYISDIQEKSAQVGWRQLKKDKAPNDTPIELLNLGKVKRYAKGLGAHATSSVVYDLEGKGYSTFESYVGIDQSMAGKGAASASFKVYLDEELAYESGMFRHDTASEFVKIDLGNAKELKLVTDSKGNNDADQTVWADAKFTNNNVKPSLTLDEELTTVKLNSNFDLAKGISAKDLEDGNLTDKIQIVPNNFTTNKTGKYTVEYSVTDSDGNKIVKEKDILVYSDESYASDNRYTIQKSGWGGIKKDKAPAGTAISVLVNGKETVFEKGIGAHANSEITFDLSGNNYEYFTSRIGLDGKERGNQNASAKYKVLVDGKEVFESKVFKTNDNSEVINIPIKGAKEIKLITDQANANDWSDQTVWADAKFLVTNTKPIIDTEDVTIKVGESINVNENVTATDAEDGDLTSKIEIVSNNFEENKVGRFEVVYRITDSDGNVTEKTKRITVYDTLEVKKSQTLDNLNDYNEQFKLSVVSAKNNAGNYGDSVIAKSIDGDRNTHWETNSPNNNKFKNEVVFDLGEAQDLERMSYKARNGGKGFASKFSVYVSSENEGNDFVLVGNGEYKGNTNDSINFKIDRSDVTRVKFVFDEAREGWASIGEMTFYKKDDIANKVSSIFTNSNKEEVTENYNTLEKIKALREEAKSHPANDLFQADFDKAEELIKVAFPTLELPANQSVKLGQTVEDLVGDVKAIDKKDGDLSSKVIAEGMDKVNFNKAGVYEIKYSVTDSDNNTVSESREIRVVDLKDFSYLSDTDWKSGNAGSALRKDVSTGNTPMRLLGQDNEVVNYNKGIGTHSYSTIVYDLSNKNADYFSSFIGIDRQMINRESSVEFKIYLDGEEAYDSGLMQANDPQKYVELNVTGVKELKLVVTDYDGTRGADWANWADAKLHYAVEGIEVDKSKLDSLIEEIENLDEVNYTQESFNNVKVVLAEVKERLNDGYNQDEINSLYEKLNEAKSLLEEVLSGARKELKKLVEYADTLDITMLGAENHIEARWANFEYIRDTSKEYLTDLSKNDEEINDMSKLLIYYIEELQLR